VPMATAATPTSDDGSSESTPMLAACDMTRASRRRLRQRANKKRGKGVHAQANLEDGCTMDEEMCFYEVNMDPLQPHRAVRPVPTTEIPQVPIVEIDVGRVQDVPMLPKLSSISVPVCAYQAVQRLDDMPQISVEDAMVIKSGSRKAQPPSCMRAAKAAEQPKMTALPCGEMKSIPVMNTFIHFDFEMCASRVFGSCRRARSSSL